jgi:hypothetical protein
MLGHTHGPHNPSLKNLYSLQDQILHKIQCFDKLRSRFASREDGKQPKFFICGHSIGAYVCSQVIAGMCDFSFLTNEKSLKFLFLIFDFLIRC